MPLNSCLSRRYDRTLNIALGIDTGGTYTDAALIDQESGEVLAGAKSLTTRHDLSLGITRAMEEVLGKESRITVSDISLVGLSTTLATNAIVEGQGNSVCLLLIGYDAGMIRKYGFEEDLVTPWSPVATNAPLVLMPFGGLRPRP